MKSRLIAIGVFIAAVAVLIGLVWYQNKASGVDQSLTTLPWNEGSVPTELAASNQPDIGEMVLVPAGIYVTGDESPVAQSNSPRREVQLDAFYIDAHEVTNAQFAEFVEATGYVTQVEKEGYGWIYKYGWNTEFQKVKGADWRHPLGPESSIEGAEHHPVVLISWHDASAYAEWAGKRLPTEAEWEVASRAGIVPEFAHSGSAMTVEPEDEGSSGNPSGHAMDHEMLDHLNTPDVAPDNVNVWQGEWPSKIELKDGYYYTAPVMSYAPNPIGVYDTLGNVWEWTADWYSADYYTQTDGAENPQGPETGERRVAKGGSWFCSPNYCAAYRPGFRGKSPPTRGFNNVGFRCAKDAEETTS